MHLISIVDQFAKQSKKIAWNSVAESMRMLIPNFNKEGKKCRQRWINNLNPNLKSSGDWTKEQNEILFSEHDKLGNKWSQIAKKLPGRTDNCIKNYFNLLMRRGLIKINSYIRNIKRKQVLIKKFQSGILSKIIQICEGKNDDKFQFQIQAKEKAHLIKNSLFIISIDQSEEDEYNSELKEKIVNQIIVFKKICRRRKKRKNQSQKITKDKKIPKNILFSSISSVQKKSKNQDIQESQIQQSNSDEQIDEVKEENEIKDINQNLIKSQQPNKIIPVSTVQKKIETLPNQQKEIINLTNSNQTGPLLNSFSQLSQAKSEKNSQFFNFLRGSGSGSGFSFLNSIQDVTPIKKQKEGDQSHNIKGLFDFNNFNQVSEFGKLIEEQQVNHSGIFPTFSNAFGDPLLNLQILSRSFPQMSSSGLAAISSNSSKSSQQPKLKYIQSQAQKPNIQEQINNSKNKTYKSLSL